MEITLEYLSYERMDKDALHAFKSSLSPSICERLKPEEQRLVLDFLIDPKGTFPKILEYLKISFKTERSATCYDYRKLQEASENPLVKMIVEYSRRKGWLRNGRFIWDRRIGPIQGLRPPNSKEDLSVLEEILEALKEAKEKGAENFLEAIDTMTEGEIWLEGNTLFLDSGVVFSLLGKRQLEEGKELKEAEECLKQLYVKWKSLCKEAEEKGWIYKDEHGKERFIWSRELSSRFNKWGIPEGPKDPERLLEIREALQELKRKGVDHLLDVRITEEGIVYWTGSVIYLGIIPPERREKERRRLRIEDAIAFVDKLYEEWKEEGFFEAKERKWIYKDEEGRERWIWDRNFYMLLSEKLFPRCPEDAEVLKEVRERLQEVKEKGTEKFLEIGFSLKSGHVLWEGKKLKIPSPLIKKALGLELRWPFQLTFEGALDAIEWLYRRCEKEGLFGAEEKGWTYEDGGGERRFIWDREYGPGEAEKIKRALKELKEKKAEKFLLIVAGEGREVCWKGEVLRLGAELVSEALGKEVSPGEELTFVEAEKVVSQIFSGRKKRT